ncbi:hypothetical protein TNIN_184521 [Trichonephila inaurata madagascariensis]|uniref:Uncharacterized protein n=1 Tax=Trichonephila inaurata madagascariensis TaxID=2747483 RepID=A0A8X7BW28_9ARAC|nr:hypothetical protein TNIN_184521 [Trichonephila inaurata madagascariensis]
MEVTGPPTRGGQPHPTPPRQNERCPEQNPSPGKGQRKVWESPDDPKSPVHKYCNRGKDQPGPDKDLWDESQKNKAI